MLSLFLFSFLARQYHDDVIAATIRRARTLEEERVLKEVVMSFQRYFDAALGVNLLYKVERLQYLDILESYPHCSASYIYGPEHFLRLMVKLPEYMNGFSAKTMKPEEVFLFNSHVESVLRYITKRAAELFSMGNYENQTPEYQRLLAD